MINGRIIPQVHKTFDNMAVVNKNKSVKPGNINQKISVSRMYRPHEFPFHLQQQAHSAWTELTDQQVCRIPSNNMPAAILKYRM